MKLATYNVYFDDKHYIPRFKHIIQTLKQHQVQIICLQEINQPQLIESQRTLEDHGYFYQSYASNGDYGILVAASLDVDWVSVKTIPFKDTIMGRNFIHLTINHPISKTPIHIFNTHLESMYQFQETRKSQINQMIEYAKTHNLLDHLILAGDLNTYFHHIWSLERVLTPQVKFPTWFANRVTNNNRTAWFDRIYTGPKIKLLPDSLQTIGDQIIPELGVHPSDHNGLVYQI